MGENRKSIRRPVYPHRRCALGLLSFLQLERAEHAVRVVDISSSGIGIISDQPIEQGLVWFPGGIEDHRGGLLVWSRKQEHLYRAGIRFLPLAEHDEQFFSYWPPCDGQLRPCSELEAFISTWVGAAGIGGQLER